ncbi:Hypothetical predicted protein [Octopus vulgaris]|uniref:Uncharacterized protein n=1 Tax=Octopus vulgaris TaxID=6645 RepID=A0AA36BHX3_OCTVU|nr:Hypothetical predicted protein [Octopus vulgaris]
MVLGNYYGNRMSGCRETTKDRIVNVQSNGKEPICCITKRLGISNRPTRTFHHSKLRIERTNIPPKKRWSKKRVLVEPKVNTTTKNVQRAFNCYPENPNEEHRLESQTAKATIQCAYDTIEEEELDCMIDEVKAADAN